MWQSALKRPLSSVIPRRIRSRRKELAALLNKIVLYAQDVEKTVDFYKRHFGFYELKEDDDKAVSLIGLDGGASLMVRQAGKGQQAGQSTVRLVFDVEDVGAFCAKCASEGLRFGALQQADGYVFANAKDPCKNALSVSGRAFRACQNLRPA
ncbi:VOC family protein [Mesorhizobium sp. M1A.F.Ca.IN.022.05.2.1]|nr:VOC family protein [Mesorhizobium sp. M1A.F.Ca.IN.022.05.2.1]